MYSYVYVMQQCSIIYCCFIILIVHFLFLHLFLTQFKIFLIWLISACDKDYIGQNYEVICSFPSYGLNCQQSIFNCTETKRDHVYGCTGRLTNHCIIWNNLICPELQFILKSRVTMFYVYQLLIMFSL